LKNNLTFLLAIKDRPEVSLRLVKHLNKSKFNFNIIVADGGKKNQKKIFYSIKRHKIIYKRFPYDKNMDQFLKKLYLASKIIKTEFCGFMESDEFIVSGTYNYLVRFLKKNPNYNFVTAKLYNFNVSKNKKLNITGLCRTNFGELLTKNFSFFPILPATWEGVHRTRNFKKSLELIIRNFNNGLEISTFHKFFNALICSQGDIKFFDKMVLSFRQGNTHMFDKHDGLSSNQYIPKIKTLHFIRFIGYFSKMFICTKNNFLKDKKISLFYFLSNFLIWCIKKDIAKILKLVHIKFFGYKKLLSNKSKSDKLNKKEKKIFLRTVKV